MRTKYDEIKDLENPDTVLPVSKVDETNKNESTPSETHFNPILGDRINERLLDGLFNKNRTTGFTTGYRSIDRIAGGIKVGTLTVLVAGTGMGKSILAMNILVNVNRDLKMPVVYIDLENGALETTERLIKIWHGEALPEDFFDKEVYKEDVLRMKQEFKSFHYYSHDDFPSVSRDMVVKLIKYQARQGVKVFLVDPLECIPAEDVFDKQREEGLIVRELKNLAQEEDIAIILCHHFRKTASGKDTFVGSIADVENPKVRIPTLDDMRGTSEIGDASTGVWALVRTNGVGGKETVDRALFRVLKNRFGSLGDAYLDFLPSPLGFRELSTEQLIEFYEEKNKNKVKKANRKKAEMIEKANEAKDLNEEQLPGF